jgi:methylphosphotriester-DNA--protein-cysteine methyltransferase
MAAHGTGRRVHGQGRRAGFAGTGTVHHQTRMGWSFLALSEKSIEPLAAFNPARFTDRSKVDGSSNCMVLAEADILSWLLTFAYLARSKAMWPPMMADADALADGCALFVGVTSTGVYCRPVCRVRTPRRENCRFFDDPRAGRSRCLPALPEVPAGDRTRPVADGLFAHAGRHGGRADRTSRARRRTLRLPQLAARLGVTDRHLRRIFQAAHGVAPLDYLSTQRLLLAKQLLTDTPMPVTRWRWPAASTACAASTRPLPSATASTPRAAARRAGRMADRPLRLAYRPPLRCAGAAGLLCTAAGAWMWSRSTA